MVERQRGRWDIRSDITTEPLRTQVKCLVDLRSLVRSLTSSMDSRGDLAAVVDELFFKDEHLQYLCHVGLTKQLTRTADGGSDAIRVKELAEMVKHLRKAVQAYHAKLQQLQSTDVLTHNPPNSGMNAISSQKQEVETQTSPRLHHQGADSTCSKNAVHFMTTWLVLRTNTV